MEIFFNKNHWSFVLWTLGTECYAMACVHVLEMFSKLFGDSYFSDEFLCKTAKSKGLQCCREVNIFLNSKNSIHCLAVIWLQFLLGNCHGHGWEKSIKNFSSSSPSSETSMADFGWSSCQLLSPVPHYFLSTTTKGFHACIKVWLCHGWFDITKEMEISEEEGISYMSPETW